MNYIPVSEPTEALGAKRKQVREPIVGTAALMSLTTTRLAELCFLKRLDS